MIQTLTTWLRTLAQFVAASYYNNSTSTPEPEPWFAGTEGNTLNGLGRMATRTLSFIIGPGQQIPGGGGNAGPIIGGIVVAGAFLGGVAGTRLGAPAGAVVAIVTIFGLVSVGLAPVWLKIVLIGLVGLAVTAALLRVTA
ncbi:hypothetical protein EI982_14655 [Haloplanus rallus]|uniref:Uncharacterized protein n=1 Tax=Haloplanus rallus TaxID=1816183 RepID=A0A6B9F603_9EURY|nr:hypothetical protein [Haloplanus rallus]QGX95936.1 hypothetical protein EI982_14655 [Haloplanus rallus]